MNDLLIYGILFVVGISYLIYFRPKWEEKRDALIFDNRVLATIDGLYLSGMNFGCSDFAMRNHARHLLEKAHALPNNQFLLEHTRANGYTFRSHMGLYGDHINFALLCIIDYAKVDENEDLIKQCEQLLISSAQTPY